MRVWTSFRRRVTVSSALIGAKSRWIQNLKPRPRVEWRLIGRGSRVVKSWKAVLLSLEKYVFVGSSPK